MSRESNERFRTQYFHLFSLHAMNTMSMSTSLFLFLRYIRVDTVVIEFFFHFLFKKKLWRTRIKTWREKKYQLHSLNLISNKTTYLFDFDKSTGDANELLPSIFICICWNQLIISRVIVLLRDLEQWRKKCILIELSFMTDNTVNVYISEFRNWCIQHASLSLYN
jgi:hypothetical protein